MSEAIKTKRKSKFFFQYILKKYFPNFSFLAYLSSFKNSNTPIKNGDKNNINKTTNNISGILTNSKIINTEMIINTFLFFIFSFANVSKLINPYKYQTYTQTYFSYPSPATPNENRFRSPARRLLSVLLFVNGAGILEFLHFLKL